MRERRRTQVYCKERVFSCVDVYLLLLCVTNRLFKSNNFCNFMAEAGNTYQLEPEKDEMYLKIDAVSSRAGSEPLSRALS